MTQYLILHKVRGEPAFDIAEQVQIGGEEGWIIPTSGHRAYPLMEWPLGELLHWDRNLRPMKVLDIVGPVEGHPEWAGCPDHYQITELPARKGGMDIDIGSILSDLMPTGRFPRRA